MNMIKHKNKENAAGSSLNYSYRLMDKIFPSKEALLPAGGLAPDMRCTGDDLIWGSLLGDAHCNKRGNVCFDHSVSATPYLFWKWELLRNQGLLAEKSRPKLLVRRDKRNRKFSFSVRFFTRNLYKRERQLLYLPEAGREIKSFPTLERVSQRWTPGALAIWYMDDGGPGGNSKRGCVIDVTCWGASGRREIRRTFQETYQLETSFHSAGAGVKLFIPQRSYERFRDLIAPYILPSMFYKISHLLGN